MVSAAAAGDLVDRGEGPFELADMQSWAEERTVRAAVLGHLLVAELWPVHPRGIRLRGVRIGGHLNLEAATLRCPLSMDCCYLDADEPVGLDDATALYLTLTGCQLAGLSGNTFTSKGTLDLSGSALTGPLVLQGAGISGQLVCRGAQLTGTDSNGHALIAWGIKVGNIVVLDEGFTATGGIWFADADIAGQFSCRGAKLTGADSDGYALNADRLKAGGDVYLDAGFTAAGAVRLVDADIGRGLSFYGAKLTGADADGNALVAAGVKVGGDVSLQSGFTAAGAIQLPDADIGSLTCGPDARLGTDSASWALIAYRLKARGDVHIGASAITGGIRLLHADIGGWLMLEGIDVTSTYDGTTPALGAALTLGAALGVALDADGIKVGAGLWLDGTFNGAVHLAGADIAGKISAGSRLTGTDSSGHALIADGVKVGAELSLRGLRAVGPVRLAGADIAGGFECSEAELAGSDTFDALIADGVKVGADVLLDWFSAVGTVSLKSAQAGGQVVLAPGPPWGADQVEFSLNAAGAQVTGALRWAPTGPVSGQVNLEGAAAGALEDDWTGKRANGYWPTGGQLRLDGFTYQRFGGDQQATVDQRLAWIRSQYQPAAADKPAAFATQPYEQLAAVYRQTGQDTQARTVAIARRADLRKYGNLNWSRKIGNWFLYKTIRYGYETWRAIVGLAVVFVAFLALSILGQHQHVIVPIGDIRGLSPVPSATLCTSDYPCFYPAGYTVDTVIPIINVHQADFWGPNGHAPWGWIWVGGTWMAKGLGWALATLLAAGYTGLVHRD
jgi:hypothetical protein